MRARRSGSDVEVRVEGPSGSTATFVARPTAAGRRRLRSGARAGDAELVAGDGGGAGSAWTVGSAAAAARRRWNEGHPAVATVVELSVPHPSAATVGDLLERARAELAPLGVRRVDLRTAPTDPALASLRAAGWFTGVAGGEVVASWCITAAWRDADAGPGGITSGGRRRGRGRGRGRGRLGRRLATVRPRDLPALAATAAAEARGRLAERRHPSPESSLSDPPPGSVHHEATRYRTIRRALELVPSDFRGQRFLDVGCGDGRVLGVARSLGFTDLAGVEHDPGLAAAAEERLGPSADISLADARTAPLDDRTGVVYLFNPFDEAGVIDVARAVGASLERRPRPLLVVYVNPRAVSPFLAAGLAMVHLEPQFCVLAT